MKSDDSSLKRPGADTWPCVDTWRSVEPAVRAALEEHLLPYCPDDHIKAVLADVESEYRKKELELPIEYPRAFALRIARFRKKDHLRKPDHQILPFDRRTVAGRARRAPPGDKQPQKQPLRRIKHYYATRV